MQDERSQLQNRARAMQVLRARLLEAAERERDAERSAERRAQVGGGGRSEKIRTYNFKENRLTDHRIGFTIYRLADVLAGDLDDVVAALAADERARQLADDDRDGTGARATRHVAGAARRDDRRGSASARRPAGCARWRAAPTASRTVLDEPATAAHGRPPRRDDRPLRGRRAAGLRARPVGVPPPRPRRRPAGADPAAGDRGRRRRRHRARPVAAAGRSPSPTSAPARARSGWRWPTSCRSTA